MTTSDRRKPILYWVTLFIMLAAFCGVVVDAGAVSEIKSGAEESQADHHPE
jgi:hypothetical protein